MIVEEDSSPVRDLGIEAREASGTWELSPTFSYSFWDSGSAGSLHEDLPDLLCSALM
jgi:hypothetical protein